MNGAARLAGVVMLAACACRANGSGQRLELKARCAEAGRRAREELRENLGSEIFLGEPQYAYSEQFETCLYADAHGLISQDTATSDIHYFVMDVFSGRTLAEYSTNGDGIVFRGTTKQEFEKKRKELMGF